MSLLYIADEFLGSVHGLYKAHMTTTTVAIVLVHLHWPAFPVKNWRILLPTCHCCQQLAHADKAEDAGVLLNSVTHTVSPLAQL